MCPPRNCIEDFGPAEFPMRRRQNRTADDIAHSTSLSALFAIRRDLCRFGHLSCYKLGPLNSVLARYTASANACLRQAEDFHETYIRGIKYSFAVAKVRINANHRCPFSPSARKEKRDAAEVMMRRITAAEALFARREDEVRVARLMMHRHLAMNAFHTSDLSWMASKFVLDGVRQGCFARGDSHAYQLTHNTAERDEGHYRLTLAWVPCAGATKYPAVLLIDRLDDEVFAIQQIHWADYEGAGNELDLDPRFRPRTVTIIAKIHCHFVADEKGAERAAVERDEMAEQAYKRSLPFWKRLVYQAGDYREALASAREPASSQAAQQ